jgi:hypothetical protein
MLTYRTLITLDGKISIYIGLSSGIEQHHCTNSTCIAGVLTGYGVSSGAFLKASF